eukprot:1142130-Rhodomonas_salina.1
MHRSGWKEVGAEQEDANRPVCVGSRAGWTRRGRGRGEAWARARRGARRGREDAACRPWPGTCRRSRST